MFKMYRAPALRAALSAALFLLALMALSCARRQEKTKAQPSSSPPSALGQSFGGQAAAQATAGRARPPAAPGAAPQPTAAKPTAATPPLAASLRAFGLGGDELILPEDFDIGDLQDLRAKDAAQVLPLVNRLIAGLASGKLDKGLFDPVARDALALILAPPKAPVGQAADPRAYRIGVIHIEGDSASLSIGIPVEGSPARQLGRLDLLRLDGNWYVQSLALENPQSTAKTSGGAFDLDSLRQRS